ncbi:MAG: DoxX family protein [Actinomycetota bacterium]|nr:DoxX family protein [Actinomycetota bacterium]
MNITRGTAWGHRAGRLLLAGQFVYGGYLAARDPGARPAALERAGMPGGADLVRLNGGAMVVGGLALGAGVLPRAASIGLIASLLPTTVIGHPFWREQDPAARSAHTLQFVKNLSMLGGLLIAATSPQPDHR